MRAEEKRQYEAGRSLDYELARIEALAGDGAAAGGFLRASLAANEGHVMMLHIDPAFRRIRTNVAFLELVAAVGLPTMR